MEVASSVPAGASRSSASTAPMTAGKSSSRRRAGADRRQHSADHQPRVDGGGQIRSRPRHQHRLGKLSDPDLFRCSAPRYRTDRRPTCRRSAPARRPAPAWCALGNAVFDAVGVRLRTVPFTPERVKAALAGGRADHRRRRQGAAVARREATRTSSCCTAPGRLATTHSCCGKSHVPWNFLKRHIWISDSLGGGTVAWLAVRDPAMPQRSRPSSRFAELAAEPSAPLAAPPAQVAGEDVRSYRPERHYMRAPARNGAPGTAARLSSFEFRSW